MQTSLLPKVLTFLQSGADEDDVLCAMAVLEVRDDIAHPFFDAKPPHLSAAAVAARHGGGGGGK